MAENQKYLIVDPESLKLGMLVERSIYVYLAGNDRYIRMVRPLHILEKNTLEKIKKIGRVYSNQSAIEKRFPNLEATPITVRQICDDHSMAPFEKNKAIRTHSKWLVPQVLKRTGDKIPALLFFHRAFGVPREATLQYVSDLSVVMYEQSLVLAGVAGTIALWLGYSDTNFLSQFVETVFCEEIGAYHENILTLVGPLTNAQRAAGLSLLRAGKVPGTKVEDSRFHLLMAGQALGDELVSIVQTARWFCGMASPFDSGIEASRVARKLMRQFDLDLNEEQKSDSGGKVAA